jgi:hypothetical protein
MENEEGGSIVDHDFEDIVEQVALMDKTLGLYALSQFTPKR